MISFYPGPSRVHDEIPRYVKDAFKKGIMSVNHRSEEFMKMSERTITLLKKKLNVPNNYTIFYTTSATECWEIIAQSLINKKSYHLYNGSFGQKWYDYTNRLRPAASSHPFDKEELIDAKKYRFEGSEGVICITQNETSNGTQVSNAIIREIKENNPGHLMAIDATSSLAGINLDLSAADIWFASVQKCFGLPAGLALMICSPAVIEKMKSIGEKEHYNSLTFMYTMMEKWQTSCTPNVLGIYLLMRVMEVSGPIKSIEKTTKKRYENWLKFFENSRTIHHLVENENVHSYTVIPVSSDPQTVQDIKKAAKKKGILLGEGYGELKATTFRIANFPAIKASEIIKLENFLKSFV